MEIEIVLRFEIEDLLLQALILILPFIDLALSLIDGFLTGDLIPSLGIVPMIVFSILSIILDRKEIDISLGVFIENRLSLSLHHQHLTIIGSLGLQDFKPLRTGFVISEGLPIFRVEIADELLFLILSAIELFEGTDRIIDPHFSLCECLIGILHHLLLLFDGFLGFLGFLREMGISLIYGGHSESDPSKDGDRCHKGFDGCTNHPE